MDWLFEVTFGTDWLNLWDSWQGVLRIHVIEAKNLAAKDMALLSKGKSDPYCIVRGIQLNGDDFSGQVSAESACLGIRFCRNTNTGRTRGSL